jgi:hypothetical protein
MENAKSSQKKSTKKFLKIFQNHSSKKAVVSPQEEWFPSFTVSDNSHASSKNNRHSNDDVYHHSQHHQFQQQQPVTRSNSIQRRYSFSNVHESGKQRLLAAKRAEYQEKMMAFDDLIQRRRGSTLRLALAPDVTSH